MRPPAASERLILVQQGVLPVDRCSAAQIGIQVETSGIPEWRWCSALAQARPSRRTPACDRCLDRTAQRALRQGSSRRARWDRGCGASPSARPTACPSSADPCGRSEQAARHAPRAPTHVALYVRTALDPAARPRLRAETTRYAGYRSYAANLARHDMNPDDTVLDAALQPLAARLHAYRRGVDEVILRAIVVDDTLEDIGDSSTTPGRYCGARGLHSWRPGCSNKLRHRMLNRAHTLVLLARLGWTHRFDPRVDARGQLHTVGRVTGSRRSVMLTSPCTPRTASCWSRPRAVRRGIRRGTSTWWRIGGCGV